MTTIQELIRDAIESRLNEVHVSIPGIVNKYDSLTQTADIQPVLKKKYNDGEIVNLPMLINVPIIFPRTANAYIHLPIKKNDYVLLVFCERSIDKWIQKGGLVDPEDYRKHSLSDAVAIPGFFPRGNEIAETNDLALANVNMRIGVAEDKINLGKIGSTQTENLVLGQVIKTYLEGINNKLASILDILVAGDHVISTSPGTPTAPNATRALEFTNLKIDIENLKENYISNSAFLSDILFTEKGN